MAWYGHVELARHLLSVGAYVNPKDNTGEVPLHFAAGNSQSEMCQLLILAGGDVNAKDIGGVTPLHKAASGSTYSRRVSPRSYPETVQLLIDASADVNAKDNLGKTPLREAVWQVDPEVVRLLIETGADINVKDIDDDTPLHEVATGLMLALDKSSRDPRIEYLSDEDILGRGNELTRLLIEAGVDIHAHDEWKQTPLHDAAWCGRTETLKWLISVGADVNVKDSNGQTPLDKAEELYDESEGDSSPYQTKSALIYAGGKRGGTSSGCLTALAVCMVFCIVVVVMASCE